MQVKTLFPWLSTFENCLAWETKKWVPDILRSKKVYACFSFLTLIHTFVCGRFYLLHSFSRERCSWCRRFYMLGEREEETTEFKRGNRVSFDPCVNTMGWRPYCPSRMEASYCTFGFGAIIQCDLRTLSLLCDSLHDNQFAGLARKKSGSTITHLHTWQQDGRHKRFPL